MVGYDCNHQRSQYESSEAVTFPTTQNIPKPTISHTFPQLFPSHHDPSARRFRLLRATKIIQTHSPRIPSLLPTIHLHLTTPKIPLTQAPIIRNLALPISRARTPAALPTAIILIRRAANAVFCHLAMITAKTLAGISTVTQTKAKARGRGINSRTTLIPANFIRDAA